MTEDTTNQDKFEIIKMVATEIMKMENDHEPQLIAITSEGCYAKTFSNLPISKDVDKSRERIEFMLSAGISLARQAQAPLKEIYFVSEGWMSKIQGKIPENYTRPSQDPNKIEVLMITGVNFKIVETKTAMLEVVRDDKNKVIDLKEQQPLKEKGVTFKNNLLEAFVYGYQKALKVLEAMKLNSMIGEIPAKRPSNQLPN